jgi:hypothetical protein
MERVPYTCHQDQQMSMPRVIEASRSSTNHGDGRWRCRVDRRRWLDMSCRKRNEYVERDHEPRGMSRKSGWQPVNPPKSINI